jgi:hypothetical protein
LKKRSTPKNISSYAAFLGGGAVSPGKRLAITTVDEPLLIIRGDEWTRKRKPVFRGSVGYSPSLAQRSGPKMELTRRV